MQKSWFQGYGRAAVVERQSHPDRQTSFDEFFRYSWLDVVITGGCSLHKDTVFAVRFEYRLSCDTN